MFHFRQAEMVRLIPVIFIAGFVSLYVLATRQIPMIWDYPTLGMICFGLWLMASTLWTDNHQAIHEMYSLVALLILGYLARFADYAVIFGVILAVGTAFAIMSTYHRRNGKTGKDWERKKIHYVFGNPTHSSQFDILPLFISLWASFEISFFFLAFTAILLIDIYNQKTEGTFIGLVSGFIIIGIIVLKWYMLLALLFLSVVITPYKNKKKESKFHSIYIRFAYWIAAWDMIKRRYLFGLGLNMFRKELENMGDTMKELRAKLGVITGHRPHNDLLDIALELGLFGLIIFVFIFVFIPWGSINPFLIGGFVAWMVAGLFFFPLREIHTALPFWCFVGVLMGLGSVEMVVINPIIAVVVGLLVLRILYATSIKALGVYFFHCTQNGKYPNELAENIKKAIGCDPYNGNYLMYGVLFHVEKEPEVAFEYAMRQLVTFDGGKVKWGVYDQFSRVVMRISGLGLADIYCKKALALNPDFTQAKEMFEFINKTKENMVKK